MGLGLKGRLARHALLRRFLARANLSMARMGRGAAVHPLDRRYGVETQAHFPAYLSLTGSEADRHLIPYAGCVPSALRRVLQTLPAPEGATFLDLGCGKGRALIVASEMPFRRIIGVEILPELVSAARRNVARVHKSYPARPRIVIQQGDASHPDWPAGPVVVFLYHPFDHSLVQVLKDHMKSKSRDETFVIYENPVHGDIFDADEAFVRWFSGMLDYEPEELGLGFDQSESIVVWRYSPYRRLEPRPGADRRIDVVLPGLRAVLA